MQIGSQANGELNFIDAVSLMSFFIGLQNLDLNVTQEDAQRLEHHTNETAEKILSEIHSHLEEQDKKIDKMLQWMEEHTDGFKRDIFTDFSPPDSWNDDT